MEQQVVRKSWFSRNWKWALPIGGCLTMIILGILFFGAVFFGVSSLLSKSTPYQEGLATAQENERVIEVLGTPIETDGMTQGSVNTENSSGNADIKLPLKGPHGTATLYVVARKDMGTWMYEQMVVVIDGSEEQIDLLSH